MAINTGVNVSKGNGLAVLAPPAGISVSKGNSLVVLGPNAGINTSKASAYAVLTPGNFSAPVWGAFTFGDAVVNNSYLQSWDLAPAATPTSYSIVAGALPTGLTLASVGGTDQGSVSGIPTIVGSYTFTIRATNAYGTADKVITMNVNAPAGGSGGGAWVFIS
jgi:hypothetical protein